LLALLYPPRCFLCGRELRTLRPLCDDCLQALPSFSGPVCRVCGVPVEEGIDLCRECAVEPRPFSWARSLGPYRGELRALVLGLKYGKEVALARFLGQRMAGLLVGDVRVVTYVPRDPKRPGFHGAEALAREVARTLGLPMRALLRKLRSTPPQVSLSWAERRENLRGAFRATPGRGEAVLLVDDVYTTGATVSECSRALLEAGYGEVGVLTAARSLPDED